MGLRKWFREFAKSCDEKYDKTQSSYIERIKYIKYTIKIVFTNGRTKKINTNYYYKLNKEAMFDYFRGCDKRMVNIEGEYYKVNSIMEMTFDESAVEYYYYSNCNPHKEIEEKYNTGNIRETKDSIKEHNLILKKYIKIKYEVDV